MPVSLGSVRVFPPGVLGPCKMVEFVLPLPLKATEPVVVLEVPSVRLLLPVIAPPVIVPEILRLPACWLVGDNRANVPLLSEMVKVRAALAVPVKLKLLVALPPRYKLRKGLALEPRSMLVEPASSEVLIATLVRLESEVLVPAPAAW